MLSGIGPADHLRQHGIEPIVDSPNVGRRLQDHPFVPAQFLTRGLRDLVASENLLQMGRWLVRHTGPLTSPVAEVCAFVRSRDDLPAPDLQFHLIPASDSRTRPHARSRRRVDHVRDVGGRGQSRPDPLYAATIPGTRSASIRTISIRMPMRQALVRGLQIARDIAAHEPLAGRIRPRDLAGCRRSHRCRPAGARPGRTADAVPSHLDLRARTERRRRGRPRPARAWCAGPARRRRLGHARGSARQHQRPDHRHRRTRRRSDHWSHADERQCRYDCHRNDAIAAPTFASLNPATGDVVGEFPIHTADDVRSAVEAARPAAIWWRELGFDERRNAAAHLADVPGQARA